MSSLSPITSESSKSANQSQPSIIAPRDRSEGRDVHIYDAKDPSTIIGGLILTNGVTNANFYSMVEILLLFTSNFELQDKDETAIQRNNDQLQPGNYYVHSSGKFIHIYF